MANPEQLFGTLLDPTAYGAYFDGIRDDTVALRKCADALAGAQGTIILYGTPRVSTTLSLPSNVNVWALMGCRATADSGVTVTINGLTTASEQATTAFSGAGTWTFVKTPAIAGGTVSVPISAATPAAETFGAAGAAGSSGQVSDAGHVHPLSATAGGDLLGSTYPNPVIAAGAVTTAKLAAGAATGAALGSDVATLTGTQTLTNKTLTSPTIGGHVASSGTAPTAAAGSAAGTSPPAPVVQAGSTDFKGGISYGTGTSPTAGAMVDVTFATAYTSAPSCVIVSAGNAATAALGPFFATVTATGFVFGTSAAPAASQGNTTYDFDYLVIE